MKNIIHWCKRKKMWTSHTYKSCTKSPVILVVGNWKAETKPNKQANPRGWIVADHTQVFINPSDEILKRFDKSDRLFYRKTDVEFTISEGEHLLFDRDGCFTLKENDNG